MKQSFFRKYTIDKIRLFNEEIGNKLFATNRQKKLNNIDFSIICNNCWGGHVYRRYSLPYNSPTVGLYFFSEEYIKFVENLETSIQSKIKMIDAKDSKYALHLEKRQQLNIPVGLINDDIEVVFLHYKTKQEAYDKWMRRCERVNLENLIFKFSEMNFCEEDHLKRFEALPYDKKILLLAYPRENLSSGIVVDRYASIEGIRNDTLYYDRWVNLTELINR